MDNAQLFEKTRRVQRELERSNDELRLANSDLESFAYSASHDLLEPLRNVAIYSQLLQKRYGGQLEGDGARFLEGILSGALRMETLIRDLLAYSRATRSIQGEPPIVDAGAVLKQILEDLKRPIEDTGAIVTSDQLPHVRIHAIHLSQLFMNSSAML